MMLFMQLLLKMFFCFFLSFSHFFLVFFSGIMFVDPWKFFHFFNDAFVASFEYFRFELDFKMKNLNCNKFKSPKNVSSCKPKRSQKNKTATKIIEGNLLKSGEQKKKKKEKKIKRVSWEASMSSLSLSIGSSRDGEDWCTKHFIIVNLCTQKS